MIERIAYHLGASGDAPNVTLAELLATTRDAKGVAEIARGVSDGNPAIAGDCIKVLYEVGYREPGLILPHAELFIRCMGSRNNRLAWGGSIALAQVAEAAAALVLDNLGTIEKALEKGSVITVDNCVSILSGMARAGGRYEKRALPILLGHLRSCRPKDVGQHAERALACANAANSGLFKAVLAERCESLPESQRKRVGKLLKRIEAEWQ